MHGHIADLKTKPASSCASSPLQPGESIASRAALPPAANVCIIDQTIFWSTAASFSTQIYTVISTRLPSRIAQSHKNQALEGHYREGR